MQGGSEHRDERTSACVSTGAQRANAADGPHGADLLGLFNPLHGNGRLIDLAADA